MECAKELRRFFEETQYQLSVKRLLAMAALTYLIACPPLAY